MENSDIVPIILIALIIIFAVYNTRTSTQKAWLGLNGVHTYESAAKFLTEYLNKKYATQLLKFVYLHKHGEYTSIFIQCTDASLKIPLIRIIHFSYLRYLYNYQCQITSSLDKDGDMMYIYKCSDSIQELTGKVLDVINSEFAQSAFHKQSLAYQNPTSNKRPIKSIKYPWA